MWKQLRDHRQQTLDRKIKHFFQTPNRAQSYSLRMGDLLFDFSKTTLDTEALWLLVNLAQSKGVEAARDAMFAGEKINQTEGRAVLHTALRAPDGPALEVDGADVMPGIRKTLDRMEAFAATVREGAFQGQGGTITDVINIGIGGSDLGPAMATAALAPYHDGPRCHFVSNIDGAQIADVLAACDPTRTLVIVASKTFTTIETMTNAQTARDWMAHAVSDPAAQFVALSSSTERAGQFGIPAERVFGFEDWVGGRYSLWGPIGLAIMLAIGAKHFRGMLRGGHVMDQHFRTAELKDNMPVMLALVGVWHHQVCGLPSRAVLPYEQRLARLPAYLQQLEMESNGKSVQMDGTKLAVPSSPVIWGEPGTNGQHAFYQMIHQGTTPVACEFIVGAKGHEPELAHQHAILVANCLAQSEALMLGRSRKDVRESLEAAGMDPEAASLLAQHKAFPGNRPSTTLMYPQLTPEILGQIIALYEHRVFVEGVLLGINSFDQWGVELGKELATALGPIVAGEQSAKDKDSSTQMLVEYVRARTG